MLPLIRSSPSRVRPFHVNRPHASPDRPLGRVFIFVSVQYVSGYQSGRARQLCFVNARPIPRSPSALDEFVQVRARAREMRDRRLGRLARGARHASRRRRLPRASTSARARVGAEKTHNFPRRRVVGDATGRAIAYIRIR